LVVIGLIVNNATFTLYRRQQENQHPGMYRPPSGSYMHPAQQQAQLGHFALSPGIPYGQQQYMGWHGDEGFGGPQQLEYQQSPSKEHRARSRSPEKALLYGS
jgi:hypothetical protein